AAEKAPAAERAPASAPAAPAARAGGAPAVATAPAPAPAERPAPAPRPAGDGGNGSPGWRRPPSPSMRRAQLEGEAEARPAQPAPAARPARAPPPAPQPAGDREEVVPMTPIRKRIAERLVEAQRETASLTTFNEVDMSVVMALRERYKQEFLDRHGVKLGFMSFFAKACVSALELFPGLNAEVRDEAIVYKKRYDLGIAVSTERGLVVPVLRGVDRLSFAEIELGINELAGKARSGKLTLDDLVGGTFSITNGG